MEKRWPDGFMDIGGLTFAEAYKKKPEFVDFTVTDMKEPTGMFREWKTYCVGRNKDVVVDSNTESIDIKDETPGSANSKC